MSLMKSRFVNLWLRLNAAGLPEVEFDDLAGYYSWPNRHYHTLYHVKECLRELDDAHHIVRRPDIVELALWYHDIIYIPGRKDNEERSARLAHSACIWGEIPFADDVERIVLATRHDRPPNDELEALAVDADLAILGQQPRVFDAYEQRLRQEYWLVSDEQFREGRAVALRHFLSRPCVFSTRLFQDKYESQARQNMERSLAACEASRP